MSHLGSRTTPLALFVALLMVVTLIVAATPTRAQAKPVTEDEAIQTLLDQPESAEIAAEIGMSAEAMAEVAIQDLGIEATLDIAEHLSSGNVDVKANFDSVKSQSADKTTVLDPQKTCAKSTAAQIVFGAFGTAICGAAAAASVGALGLPCETLLLIGTSSLDWGQVC